MRKLCLLALCLVLLTVPAKAAEMVAPTLPEEVQPLLPSEESDFGASLWHIVTEALSGMQPQVASSARLCLGLLASALLMSVLQSFEGKSRAVVELAGVIAVSCMLLSRANSKIAVGTETVESVSHYGALLLPVMTAALASQGGITASAAFYTATALFDSLLTQLISLLLVPMVYIYLVLAVVNAATGDGMLKKLRDFIKWAMTWGLKIILYVFTGYIALTGVIAGTADQTAVKAAKLTISGMIPVVGSILSDASETILVSAAAVKNTAGVAGLLAVIALTATPFLSIGLHYLLLKLTAAVAGAFAPKSMASLMEDFSGAMGLILGMTGAVCMIQLISLVCFMKGMG